MVHVYRGNRYHTIYPIIVILETIRWHCSIYVVLDIHIARTILKNNSNQTQKFGASIAFPFGM